MNDWLARCNEFDLHLSDLASKPLKSSWARLAASILAHTGDSQWWFLAGVLCWWLGTDDVQLAGQRIVVVVLLAGFASTALKRLVRRPRPAGGEGLFYLKYDRHSFPSGHATRIGGLMVLLGSGLPLCGALALCAWGVAVGVSRVALEIHFASDILAGTLMGVLIGLLLLSLGL